MSLSPAQKRTLQRLVLTAVILGHFGFFILAVGGVGWYRASELPPAPQPIAFPHPTHVLGLGLACGFCHETVDQARGAGVPAVEKCMSCHQQIARERPEVQKLIRHWDEQTPIAWVRIHELPDFIYFSHKRHVRAGVGCDSCHGPVAVMAEVRQVRTLNMGFCVACHVRSGASRDCAVCHM